MPRLDVRDDLAVFDELADWWNTRPGPMRSVFLRTEWLKLLAEKRLGRDDRLQVWVIRDSADVVAALPMFISRGRLRSLTELATESFDLIRDDDNPESVDFLLSNLRRRTYVRFEAVEAGSPLVRLTEDSPRWRVDHRTHSASIDLDGGFDEFASSLSGNLRSNLRKARRSLETLGRLQANTEPAEDWESILDLGLRLERSGWKGRSGLAILDSERRTNLFREFARVAKSRGWLRLSSLLLDDEMIAFHYDLEYGGRMIGLITAHDETLPKACSPGHTLLVEAVRAAAARGVSAFELGGAGGRNAWKLRWGTTTTPRVYLTGFGDNPGGRLAHSYWLGREQIRRVRRNRDTSQ